MLNLELKYSTGIEQCECPQSFEDLKFSKYLELLNNDTGDWFRRISILTGISEDNLKQVSTETFAMLMNAASFLSNMSQFLEGEFLKPIPEHYRKIEVAQLEAGYFFQVKDEIERVRVIGQDKMNAAPKMIELMTMKRIEGKILAGWNILDEPITNCLHIANFFLSKSGHFTNDGQD